MATVIFFILYTLIEGTVSFTVSTPSKIHVPFGKKTSIVLNCTYKDETSDNIFSVIWKKKNDKNEYEDIATFVPGNVMCGLRDLKNRSSCTNYRPNSSSAIMYINDVRCEDGGDYRCEVKDIGGWIKYSNTTVLMQVEAEKPTEFTMQPNISLEENSTVIFYCSANVGNPEGVVRIWKERRNESKKLIGESSFTDNREENCSTTARLTLHYNLSRHDHEAIFRCSSQNKTTMVPARSRVIGPADIFYGPFNVSIAVFPEKTSFYIGDRIRFTCTSDGNPKPTFQWTFNSTNIVDSNKYNLLNDNATMEFMIDNITDNGYYHCFASNIVNGKPLSTSGNITLLVQEKTVFPPETAKSCSNIICSFTEKCYSKANIAYCATDGWKIVAFVFIIFSLVLGIATVGLWVYSKLVTHRKTNSQAEEIARGGDEFEIDEKEAVYPHW